jgi:hypothetical protein
MILGRYHRTIAGEVRPSRLLKKVAWTTDAAYRFLRRRDGPPSMAISSAEPHTAARHEAGRPLVHHPRRFIDPRRFLYWPVQAQASDKPKHRAGLAPLRRPHRVRDSICRRSVALCLYIG